MHRDTVVGIVGAVVLVAVMVAVFWYEYTQVPDGEEDPDTRAGSAFAARYPSLAPSEDMDGDGVPNVADDDMDGDGVNNTSDATVLVRSRFTAALGAGAAQPQRTPLFAGTAHDHIVVFVNYTLSAPSPIGSVSALEARLLDADGQVVATGQGATVAPGGTQASIRIEAHATPAGNYTIEVSRANPGLAVTAQGVALVRYDPGTPTGVNFEK